MKNFILGILLIITMFGVNASASAKENQRYSQVILTLNDSTVLNGYLRCDLHSVNKKISISETVDGEKESYKVDEIDSLVVVYPNGDRMTFRPIYVWDGFAKKIRKTPVLASLCYSSDNMICYMVPGMYIKSTAAVPSNYFQSYTWQKKAWIFYKKIKSESEIIKLLYTYIPSNKIPKLKSILKDVKNNFKKEDFQFIVETIEAEGFTAEDIIQKPWLLLEILDKKTDEAGN